MVMWTEKLSAGKIAREVDISEQTKSTKRIEIHSRKYGVGRGTNEDWNIGGVDRVTGNVFAQRVPNRTAATLVPLLQKKIEKDSEVYSDEWRSYSQLMKYFTGHWTVKHKTQFVNMVGNRAVCTNGVEAMWARI
ncbi:unnamed protein product [Caenorhabditis sp. 36 PRJEB53466]|nr:unnamed protein product [Caenorhabditis sp. 36 PRJEB53466]